MRRCYLVCYDVGDEKRLRKTHTVMLGYGDPLQYSVFRCILSQQEKALMMVRLLEVIHPKQDRVLVVDLGAANECVSDRMEFIGRPLADPDLPEAVVV
ncbi:MAG: CRISPR-associated endonuclease Cas2 [Limnochordaceae bacterium]|nr:CRISPR-associated endonuclease Cas2 [Limnochordaceae bacterium]